MLAIAALPELRGGEGHHRQRAALAFDFAEHRFDQRLVFEAVATFESRLDDGSSQRCAQGRGPERSDLRQDGSNGLEPMTVKEKVVSHREQHMDIGFDR